MERVIDWSFRMQPKGGGVKRTPDVYPPYTVLAKEVVFLIHGFNVNRQDACKAYSAYLKGVPNTFPQIVRVFWPGDHRWYKGGALRYPDAIVNARECASRFSDWLKMEYRRRRNRLKRVTLIAHSLGSRLVLELLDAYHKEHGIGWPDINVVCLMAAAVPINFLFSGNKLHNAATSPRKLMLLYSGDDWILSYTFPVGQGAAFLRALDDEANLEAVGLHGRPKYITPRRYLVQGAGHSDYWDSYESVMYTGAHMGVVVDRRIATRRMREHELPPSRTLEVHKLGIENTTKQSYCDK